uniref:Zinc finger, CCHC-type n=1 Tax=Tanacetum cinerariifolium TaxID=118510 RepID=A0A6L2MVU9_TANCI|nr:zinc finger, CCHC-type [Tanacetum cinerariifolium]
MASSITRFDIEKFDGKNDFGLWQIKMHALMVQRGCDVALETLPADLKAGENDALMKMAYMDDVLAILKRTKGTKEETGDGLYVKRRLDHSESHLKRDWPIKKLSGSVRKGNHDQNSDSSNDEGGSYHMTPRRDFLCDFKVVDGGSVQLDSYIVRIQMGRAKMIKGCPVIMTGIMKKNFVYTLEENMMNLGVQKHGGSKQVRFKQLGSKQVGFKQLGHKQVGFKQLGSETRVHGVQVDKCVWFEVELQGTQENREAEVFRSMKMYTLGIKVRANIMVTRVVGQEGVEDNVAGKKESEGAHGS